MESANAAAEIMHEIEVLFGDDSTVSVLAEVARGCIVKKNEREFRL